MKLENPLKANDWAIGSLFKLVAGLQLAVWIVVGTDAIGVPVPILRELIVLIYLLGVPGVLLLRVLRLHHLNVIEGVLYAVGLSVTAMMLTGLFINAVYVHGITATPLTLLPFLTTMTAVVVALCLLGLWRDRTFSRPTTIDVQVPPSAAVLGLLILPFVSIFGTYMFNVSGNGVGIVITLLSVAAVIIVCGFTRYVPQRYYPLVILSIAAALLLRSALVTNYLWGFDIQVERFVAQSVVNSGSWGAPPSFDRNTLNLNTMLSITMLAPLLSITSGMSVTWVLKLVFPLLFMLVPLGLYRLFEKQTSPRIGLFAVFYFMVTFSFYTEMVAMARQELAELFLVVLLLLLVDRQLERVPRLFLFSLFGFSLIVSHYAVTYVFLFCFVVAWLLLAVVQRFDVRALLHRVSGTTDVNSGVSPLFRLRPARATKSGLSAVFFASFALIAFLWYRFANNAQPFDTLARIATMVLAYAGVRAPISYVQSAANSSDTPALPVVPTQGNGLDTTGLQMMLAPQLPMHQITEYLILIALVLSIVGIVFALAYKERGRLALSSEFVAFAAAGVGVLFLCLVQPYFAASLNMSRFLHLTQISLSVFFVIGVIGVCNVFRRQTLTSARSTVSPSTRVLACFLVILLLFNAGLVYKVAGEINASPTVFGLDKNVDFAKFTDQEMTGAKWISLSGSGSAISADRFRVYAVYTFDPAHAVTLVKGGSAINLRPGTYVYLGTPNIDTGNLVVGLNSVSNLPVEWETQYYVGGAQNVYSNGGAQIYLVGG
ncbi:MAG: DUF2206 domain-containing protein [Halobacteriota archaeon]